MYGFATRGHRPRPFDVVLLLASFAMIGSIVVPQ
jgi:hypothetical protein